MAEQSTDRDHARAGQSGPQTGYGSSGMGQNQQYQNQGQRPDDLKRQARHAEADEERNRQAAREVVEKFADRSREQIDRYERAYGEFWRVAETDGFMPFAKNLARANMEVAALASRRAKAYAEYPVQMSQCHTANELMNRHMHFWSELLNDYQQTVGRMMRAMTETANPQQFTQDQAQHVGQAMGQWGQGLQQAGQDMQGQGQNMREAGQNMQGQGQHTQGQHAQGQHAQGQHGQGQGQPGQGQHTQPGQSNANQGGREQQRPR